MELDLLRSACMALTGAVEEIKWEHDLVYTIGGKMFCVTGLEGDGAFSCKVDPERFEELLQVPGIEPAPYLARAGWVLVTPKCKWKASQQLELVRGSYGLVSAKLTKKQKGELGI